MGENTKNDWHTHTLQLSIASNLYFKGISQWHEYAK
jgi:hypothetical protein